MSIPPYAEWLGSNATLRSYPGFWNTHWKFNITYQTVESLSITLDKTEAILFLTNANNSLCNTPTGLMYEY
jgi:hypothetical protein